MREFSLDQSASKDQQTDQPTKQPTNVTDIAILLVHLRCWSALILLYVCSYNDTQQKQKKNLIPSSNGVNIYEIWRELTRAYKYTYIFFKTIWKPLHLALAAVVHLYYWWILDISYIAEAYSITLLVIDLREPQVSIKSGFSFSCPLNK